MKTKKNLTILFACLAGLIVLAVIVALSWRPLLLSQTEPCGYSGASDARVSCNCDGTSFQVMSAEATSHRCLGKCGQCVCYEQDWKDQDKNGNPELTQVDCADLSDLAWSFPMDEAVEFEEESEPEAGSAVVDEDQPAKDEPVVPETGDTKPANSSFVEYAYDLASNEYDVVEISNPGLVFRSVDEGQVVKYFQMNDLIFALAMTESTNVDLSLPSGFNPTFVGVLVAEENNSEWVELATVEGDSGDKNNPYYLFVSNGKLMLTVVDQNGAGSGEGVMNVFALSSSGNWDSQGCYYFGSNYNGPSADGDYYAYSAKLSNQSSQPMSSCSGVEVSSR
jgi:hypothetical protein